MQRRLEAYDRPGNVRELENTIQRAVTLARGPVLDHDPIIGGIGHLNSAAASAGVSIPPEGIALEETLEETYEGEETYESKLIRALLEGEDQAPFLHYTVWGHLAFSYYFRHNFNDEAYWPLGEGILYASS